MKTRTERLLLVPLIAGGVAFAALLEPGLDPYEGTGLAALGLIGGVLGFAAVCGYLYSRKVRSVNDPDERFQTIEMRASRLSHGVLTIGLLFVALAVSLPWARGSAWVLAWVLLAGSVAVHEVGIEYYRRQM